MRSNALQNRVQYLLWVVGALLCGICAYSFLDARFFQTRQNHRLEEALRSGTPRRLPASPFGPPPRRAGSLVGRLEIPRLKMSAIVLEGSDSLTLRRGIGRIPETADPGQVGNVVLSGHRDTFFRPLRNVRRGDRIMLTTPTGKFRYQVEWTSVVDPQDTAVLKPTPAESLTLVTCYPFRYVGPAPERFIVRATKMTGL